MNKIFAPLFDLRTHQHALYFLAQLVLGTVYFTVLVTGLSATAGLAMSVVGLPFAAVTGVSTLYLARQMWNGEAWLLSQYYSEDVVGFEPTNGDGLLDWMKEIFGDSSSWVAVLSGLLRLPLGVFLFTVLVVSQATFLALIASPFYYEQGLIQFGGSPLLTSPIYAVAAAFVGLIGVVASAHVIRFAGDRLLRILRA